MPREITDVLVSWPGREREALDELMPLVVEELRTLARRQLAGERTGHTLQPTALVNELYLRLLRQQPGSFPSRAHFFAFAAELMRRILVEHARARRRQKRGGGLSPVHLEEAFLTSPDRGMGLDLVLAVDEALDRLARLDRRQSRIAGLRFFTGLTVQETAEALGISRATAERDWTLARLFLAREIERHPGDAAAGVATDRDTLPRR